MARRHGRGWRACPRGGTYAHGCKLAGGDTGDLIALFTDLAEHGGTDVISDQTRPPAARLGCLDRRRWHLPGIDVLLRHGDANFRQVIRMLRDCVVRVTVTCNRSSSSMLDPPTHRLAHLARAGDDQRSAGTPSSPGRK